MGCSSKRAPSDLLAPLPSLLLNLDISLSTHMLPFLDDRANGSSSLESAILQPTLKRSHPMLVFRSASCMRHRLSMAQRRR